MNWLRSDIVYCSNVHPCSSVAELINQLYQHVIPIKKSRKLSKMSLGLWFNQVVVADFKENKAQAQRFVDLMHKEQLTILTLNAFPQRLFHGKKIKTKVYLPNWSSSKRLQYNVALLSLISAYPSIFSHEVTISTLPLGYKNNWNKQKHQQAILHLTSLAHYLADFKINTGIDVRVCLEMEPDCVLEKTSEMIHFFTDELKVKDNRDVRNHLGVCFDICHQAVMHENVQSSFHALFLAGIIVGKVQVSNALKFNNMDLSKLIKTLLPFQQSPYLHQMKVKTAEALIAFSDISPQTLDSLPSQGETRVHFHMPINQQVIEPFLLTTQSEIVEVLNYLQSSGLRPHLEVETYTWSVIDVQANNKQLNHYLTTELNWLENQLSIKALLQE
jgi:hypothetical protein